MTNKELCERYPFLLCKTHWYTGKILPEEDISYDNNWWEDIPEGWRKAFGIQMCDELLEILKKADYVDEYQIIQIKEKFGTLRWYSNGVPEQIWDEYHNWVIKYEEMSAKYCINCGSPATKVTDGWIMYVCDECYDK